MIKRLWRTWWFNGLAIGIAAGMPLIMVAALVTLSLPPHVTIAASQNALSIRTGLVTKTENFISPKGTYPNVYSVTQNGTSVVGTKTFPNIVFGNQTQGSTTLTHVFASNGLVTVTNNAGDQLTLQVPAVQSLTNTSSTVTYTVQANISGAQVVANVVFDFARELNRVKITIDGTASKPTQLILPLNGNKTNKYEAALSRFLTGTAIVSDDPLENGTLRSSVGFDWSDVSGITWAFDSQTNRLTFNIGTSFSIDPSTVGTGTVGSATLYPRNRGEFYVNGRYWVYYYDGTNMVFRSSTDGDSWSSVTNVTAITPQNFSMYWDSANSKGAYFRTAAGAANSYYRQWTFNSNGTVTYDSSEVQATTTGGYFPNVVKDSSGYPFAAFIGADGVTLYTIRASSTNGSSWDAASSRGTVTVHTSFWYPQMLALTSNKMLLIVVNDGVVPDGVTVASKSYNGTTWDSNWTTLLGDNQIYNTGAYCAVSDGDKVFFAYLEKTSTDIHSYIYDAGWGSPETVASGVIGAKGHPSVTKLTSNSYRVLFSINNTSISYRDRAGGSWGDITTFVNGESAFENSIYNGGPEVQVSETTFSNTLPIIWTTGDSNPYTVRFGYLSVSLSITNNPTSKDFGVVQASSTYWSKTNNSTGPQFLPAGDYSMTNPATASVSSWTNEGGAYATGAVGTYARYGSNPVFPAGAPGAWDDYWTQFNSAVDVGNGTYFAYYHGMADSSGARRIGLATSTDGNSWTRYGSNPILSVSGGGAWDNYSVAYPNVWQEGNQWYMLYAGGNSTNYQIGLATSSDGINWSKSGSNPVLTNGSAGTWDSVMMQPGTSMIKEGSTYYLYYWGNNILPLSGNASIGYATSTNLTSWTKYGSNPVLVGGTINDWDYAALAPAVFNIGGTYYMWYEGVFYDSGNFNKSQTGVATSTNKNSWTKYASNPVIPYGGGTNWDAVWTEATVYLRVGNEYRFYYGGSKVDENPQCQEGYAIWTPGWAWITSGSPSDNVTYSNYNLNVDASGTVTSVRVRTDAWSAGISINSTRSPTTETGSWTNATNVYDNDTDYAYITSNGPSNNHTFGGYGFAFTTESITRVQVRADAYTVGSAGGGATVTRYPTSDNLTTGYVAVPTSPATLYDKVNEVSANHSAYAVGQTQGGNTLLFNYTAFAVPVGATNIWVSVSYDSTDNASGTNNVTSAIKVGGTVYGGANALPSASWVTYTDNWTTNPKSSANWTVNDVNGVGANGLTQFGTTSGDFNPDVNVDFIHITVGYTTATTYDELLRAQVSWDGGSSWSATSNYTLTSTNASYWFDFTSATSWTASTVNDTNFKARIDAYTVGTASEVRVSYLPVQITYTSLANDQIRMKVTWDGGTNWSSLYSHNLTENLTTFWDNVTSVTTWNSTSLNNTNFKVYVDANTNGDAGEVRLDWVPVEVMYTHPGGVASYECFFTLTNDGGVTANITMVSYNFTSSGTPWSLTASSPGANQIRMTLFREGDNSTQGTVLGTSSSTFKNSVAGGAAIPWDLKFEVGVPSDGNTNNTTILFTAVSS